MWLRIIRRKLRRWSRVSESFENVWQQQLVLDSINSRSTNYKRWENISKIWGIILSKNSRIAFFFSHQAEHWDQGMPDKP